MQTIRFYQDCVFLQVIRTARDRRENGDSVQGSENAFDPMTFCAGYGGQAGNVMRDRMKMEMCWSSWCRAEQ